MTLSGRTIACLRAFAVWILATPAATGLAQKDVARSDSALATATVTTFRLAKNLTGSTPLQTIDSLSVRRLGITGTGDALRRLAGVNLRDYGGAGGLKTVSVRGLGAAHTAVSYDGICLTDARSGSIDLAQFDIDRLHSLSLHTLDSPALLTPVRNLAAATIDIRSQMPAGTSRGFTGTAALRAGSWAMTNPSLFVARRFSERAAVSASGNFFYARNNYPFRVENGVASTTERRNNSRMQTMTAEAAGDFRTRGNGTLQAKLSFRESHRRLPGQVLLYNYSNSERMADRNGFAQLRWQQSFGAWQAMAAAKWDGQTSRYRDFGGKYPTGSYLEHYRQHDLYSSLGAERAFPKGLHAAYALDASQTSLRSNQNAAPKVRRTALLQAFSLRLTRRRLTLTARGVWHHYKDRVSSETVRGKTESRLVPTVSASIRLVQDAGRLLVLRVGHKEMFRLPTFAEAYHYHLGAKKLQPELTRQTGFGLTFGTRLAAWCPALQLTADGYLNRVDNRIVSVPVNLHTWRTMNYGKVAARGLDLTFSATFRPAERHSVFLSGSYSWLRAEDRTKPNTTVYRLQLPYTPRHSGSGALAYENPWVNLSLHATYAASRWSTPEHTSTTRLPAYGEAGLAAYRAFTLGNSQLLLRADVINALDTRYEVVRRYPMPGRSFKVSAEWKF